MHEEYIIEMVGITKSFPGIVANDDITLKLKKGEIHAVLGENGAGKSTLMSVLSGAYKPDKGVIKKNGRIIEMSSAGDAAELGIGMVHQYSRLVDAFTAFENIILGREITCFGFLRHRSAEKKLEKLCERYSLEIDFHKKVAELSVGARQKTEILKMLYRDSEILIFDEPTAALTPREGDRLLEIIRTLASEGKSILFISHKLNEILSVSDRITVIRKGKFVATVNTDAATKQELSQMMMGRLPEKPLAKCKKAQGRTVLKVGKLSMKGKKSTLKNISFEICGGEIAAFAGIDGNGQDEMIDAVTGLSRISSGKIYFCGKDITRDSVRQRLYLGMSHIPEGGRGRGIVPDFNLEENCVLGRYYEKPFNNKGFVVKEEVRKYALKLMKSFDIHPSLGSLTPVKNMSDGNKQRLVVARELDKECPLIIAVHPARGIDIGAKEKIHSELIRKRGEGKAVLLVSFELDEIMRLADKIYVIYEGEITGSFYPEKITASELGFYMSGLKRQKENPKND